MSERKKSDTIGLQIRMKEGLRRRLADAAADNSVSMNAELVGRLERTFAEPDLIARIHDLQQGSEVMGFLMLVEEAITRAGMVAAAQQGKSPREWLRDPYAFDEAVKAFLYLAERLRPTGDIPAAGDVVDLPDGSEGTITGKAGASSAMMALAGVAAAGRPDAKPDTWTKAVRDRLGPLVDQLVTPKPTRGRKTK
ncbi:MAG: hypothetical protein ACFCUT_02350 [Kiloniellaceae bacterium]